MRWNVLRESNAARARGISRRTVGQRANDISTNEPLESHFHPVLLPCVDVLREHGKHLS